MTAQRPRVVCVPSLQHYVDNQSMYDNCISDDVILFADRSPCVVTFYDDLQSTEMPPPAQFLVDRVEAIRRRTEPHNDPFAYFADVLAPPGGTPQFKFFMHLLPQSDVVRTRLPWINAFWHHVSVCFDRDRPIGFEVCFFKESSAENYWDAMIGEWEVRLRSAYCNQVRVFQEIYLLWQADHDERVRAILSNAWVMSLCSMEKFNLSAVLRVRPTQLKLSAVRVMLEGFPGFIEYVPLQRTIPTPSRPMQSLDYVHVPVYTAHAQWRTYHQIILDVSLALDRRLPPYVLLWVLNWLPYFDYWSESRKIRLIESVRWSLERVPSATAIQSAEPANKE